MTEFSDALSILLQHLHQLQSAVLDVEPEKRHLKWFGKGRYTPQLHQLYTSSTDVLTHAATLIGYFDGYDVRGQFQERISHHYTPDRLDVFILFNHLKEVLDELEAILKDLLSRERLTLATIGPKKPGPVRTSELCALHLIGLQKNLCSLLLHLVTDQALRIQINHHFVQVKI